MKAVLLRSSDGAVVVGEVPAPRPGTGQVLVRTHYSLISSGTERAVLERARPDAGQRLEPMGYSSGGTVVEVAAGIDDLGTGQLVACGGLGYANHAEMAVVPRNLCVPVPAGVEARDAAFTTVGAVALHAIHQTSVEPGSRVAVVGLGLVGQLTLQLLLGYGYQALGIDISGPRVRTALAGGAPALERSAPDLVEEAGRVLGGRADAVIVTAAAPGDGDPVALAGVLARDRAGIVVVGDVALSPPRREYYGKELTIRYSRSYGPGRYDPRYEEDGIPYPDGFVAWDERRNLAEVLRMLAARRVSVDVLDPVVVDVERAAEAYALLTAPSEERPIAVLIGYGSGTAPG